MSAVDSFGAMGLPAVLGGLDPALSALLAFAKAVIVHELQTAWAGVAPDEPWAVVNETFAGDPAKRLVVERDLPALFAYVPGGKFEDKGGDGYQHEASVIKLLWLFPPASRERGALQDLVVRSIAKALSKALGDGRHVAWTSDEDAALPAAIRIAHAAPLASTTYAGAALPEAIKLPAAAPLGDTTYAGAALDGAVGAASFAKPSRILFTTTAGDWNVADPITLNATLPDGTSQREEVYLTSATGPETVESAWIYSAATSFAVPEQPSAAGTLAIGIASAPGSEFGSLISQKMGATRVRVTGWKRETITIQRTGGQAMPFEGACFDVAIEETRTRSAATYDYPALPADDGMLGSVVSNEGLTVEVSE